MYLDFLLEQVLFCQKLNNIFFFSRQNHQHMALRNGESLLAQKIARRSNGAEPLTAGNSAIFTFVPM